MKKPIASFVSFSRNERLGLLALLLLLLLLITFRATMSLWVRPPANEDEAKLAATWDSLKNAHQPSDDDSDAGTETLTKTNAPTTTDTSNPIPATDLVDLNTADSTTLASIEGMEPTAAGKIVAYRSAHGPYHDIDQLLQVHPFQRHSFHLLKNHLVISTVK